MRIITYSDLHLEFGSGWTLPAAVNGDVMILAGDIVTLRDYEPLDQILRKWKKPVLYVTGNHEYYTQRPMNEEDKAFRACTFLETASATAYERVGKRSPVIRYQIEL